MYEALREGRYAPKHVDRSKFEELIKKHGPSYLNNLPTRLPSNFDGENPRFSGFDERQIETYIKLYFDKPYGRQPDIGLGYSDVYLALTPRQFFALFDLVLEDTGLPRERALDLRRGWEDQKIGIKDVQRQLIPAFLKLIEMGFTWEDLCR